MENESSGNSVLGILLALVSIVALIVVLSQLSKVQPPTLQTYAQPIAAEPVEYIAIVEPLLPETASSHIGKHSTSEAVLTALQAYLIEKARESCSQGVTAHIRYDKEYGVKVIATICWGLNNNSQLAGWILVNEETRVWITGYTGRPKQFCQWLTRDGYYPDSAPQCLLTGD